MTKTTSRPVRVVSDRFSPTADEYPNVGAFLCMCREVFGSVPDLIARPDGWYDEQGRVLEQAVIPLRAPPRDTSDEDAELASYVCLLHSIALETGGSPKEALLQTVAIVLEDAIEAAAQRGSITAIRETVAALRREAER